MHSTSDPSRQRGKAHFTALILSVTLALTGGCSTVMDATSDGPVSENLGKRTVGTVFDDEMLESKASVNVRAAHPDLKKAHVRVIAFNGAVLLVGQVATDELRALAEQTVRDLRHVERIHNELVVAGKTSTLARMNDRILSLKVKGRLTASKEADANRVKVVTENGVVYLMGLLTRAEADAAVAVARKTGGVQKIVKVFQYLN